MTTHDTTDWASYRPTLAPESIQSLWEGAVRLRAHTWDASSSSLQAHISDALSAAYQRGLEHGTTYGGAPIPRDQIRHGDVVVAITPLRGLNRAEICGPVVVDHTDTDGDWIDGEGRLITNVHKRDQRIYLVHRDTNTPPITPGAVIYGVTATGGAQFENMTRDMSGRWWGLDADHRMRHCQDQDLQSWRVAPDGDTLTREGRA